MRPEKHGIAEFYLGRPARGILTFIKTTCRITGDFFKSICGYWYCNGCQEYHSPLVKRRTKTYFLLPDRSFCSLHWKQKQDVE